MRNGSHCCWVSSMAGQNTALREERQAPGKNHDVATAASPENTVQANGT